MVARASVVIASSLKVLRFVLAFLAVAVVLSATCWLGVLLVPTRVWQHDLVTMFVLGGACVLGLGALLFFSRFCNALVGRWNVLALIASASVLCVVAGVGTVASTLRLGVPIFFKAQCEWPGARTTRCVGRSHSALQGRLSYVRLEASIDPASCNRFRVAAEKPSTQPAETEHCDAGGAGGWRAASCASIKERAFRRCYVCRTTRSTGDIDYRSYSASAECTRIAVFQGENIQPHQLHSCLQGICDPTEPIDYPAP